MSQHLIGESNHTTYTHNISSFYGLICWSFWHHWSPPPGGTTHIMLVLPPTPSPPQTIYSLHNITRGELCAICIMKEFNTLQPKNPNGFMVIIRLNIRTRDSRVSCVYLSYTLYADADDDDDDDVRRNIYGIRCKVEMQLKSSPRGVPHKVIYTYMSTHIDICAWSWPFSTVVMCLTTSLWHGVGWIWPFFGEGGICGFVDMESNWNGAIWNVQNWTSELHIVPRQSELNHA